MPDVSSLVRNFGTEILRTIDGTKNSDYGFVMDRTPRQFVDDLGGYRIVALRLGVASKTMHTHISAGKLPPRFYVALCELAREIRVMPPSPEIFDFKPLLPSPDSDARRVA